jgi:RNA polymerase sigma-70 factor (ECF subfamily)
MSTHALPVLSTPMVLTDVHGHILYASDPVLEQTGFSEAEVVGATPGSLWGGSMTAPFYRNLWNTIAGQRRPFVGNVRNRTKQGEAFPSSLHITPVFDLDGSIMYFLELSPRQRSRDFDEEFINIFSDRTLSMSGFLGFLQDAGVFIPRRFSSLSSLARLDAFLSAVFVDPIRAKYADRLDDHVRVRDAKDNKEQFSRIYTQYFRDIQAFFRHRIRPDTVSEDLAQEVFVRAFSHLRSFEPSGASYKTYLFRIAHNLLVNHYRDAKPTRELLPDDNVEDLRARWEKQIDCQELIGHSALTTSEQEALRLKYHDGLRTAEIAKKMGKSQNAVKLHLSRGRAKLRSLAGFKNF